jgi:hypothetical protein
MGLVRRHAASDGGTTDEITLIAGDGSEVAVLRLGPDSWEVRRDGERLLVIERATSWGWVALSDAVPFAYPWLTVREAIAATHAELAPQSWAIAVAAHFDDAKSPTV